MLHSLRWRIATLYAVLLLGVIAIVALVLAVQLNKILLSEARAKIDRVGADIASVVNRNSVPSVLGQTLPIEEELTATGTLDHWAGPTTFVEIDTPAGYPEGKSTNLGSAGFDPTSAARTETILYRYENRPQLGKVLVRDELIQYPGVALIVQVGESLSIYGQTLRHMYVLLAIIVALATLVVVAGSFGIASSAIEPIGRLNAAMAEIRSDRLSRRLGWDKRRDELGSLARTFDAMLDRLEEGFARERRFISDVSHELKTPLTVINANAQILERWADGRPDVRADSLRAIRDESAALGEMVDGMLLLARAESGDDIPRKATLINDVVADTVRGATPRAEAKGLTLHFNVISGQDALVLGDANLLRQLFTNLIDNAIKFTDSGTIDVESIAADGAATVCVLDTGPGIENQALERIFDRFFRTDASRDRTVPGTGLGLSIARSIARVHRGTLSAAARPGGGTAFRVTLPTLTPAS